MGLLGRADKPLPLPPGGTWLAESIRAADLLSRVASAVVAKPTPGALEQLRRARDTYEATKR